MNSRFSTCRKILDRVIFLQFWEIVSEQHFTHFLPFNFCELDFCIFDFSKFDFSTSMFFKLFSPSSIVIPLLLDRGMAHISYNAHGALPSSCLYRGMANMQAGAKLVYWNTDDCQMPRLLSSLSLCKTKGGPQLFILRHFVAFMSRIFLISVNFSCILASEWAQSQMASAQF